MQKGIRDVESNNFKLSALIALKVETDFNTIIEKAKYRFETIALEKKSLAKVNYDKLLENDKDFVLALIDISNKSNC